MEISQVKGFTTLAKYGTMVEAAKHLQISQPALSKQIKKLETEFGVRLFDRINGIVVLNDAGKVFCAHAEKILADLDDLYQGMGQFSSHNNTINVGFADPCIMRYVVPRFTDLYPDLNFGGDFYSVSQNEINLLLGNFYDAIITDRKFNHPDIVSLYYSSDRLFLSVPPGHFMDGYDQVSFRETEPFDLFLECQVGGVLVEKEKVFLGEMEKQGHIRLEWFDNYFVLLQRLKVAGANVATISTIFSLRYRVIDPKRTLIPIVDPELEISYYISYPKTKENKVSAFVDWILEDETRQQQAQISGE